MSTAIALGVSSTLQLPDPGESYSLPTLNTNFQNTANEVNKNGKQALGLMWYKANSGDTGAINATLAVIDNCPAFTFKGGRKYRIGWVAEYNVTNSDTRGEVCIQQCAVGDPAAQITGLTRLNRHTIEANSAGITTFFNHAFIHTPAADSTVQVKFTLQQVAGSGTLAITGSAVARPLELFIEDLGAQF